MKVSSFSHQSTYFHYRCKELQLFTYLVFYLNEKTCSQPFLSLKSSSCTLYRKLPLTGRYFQNSKVFPKFVFRILEEYPSEKFSFQPETAVQRCSVEKLFLIFLECLQTSTCIIVSFL